MIEIVHTDSKKIDTIEIVHTDSVVIKKDVPVITYRIIKYDNETETTLWEKFENELKQREEGGYTKLYLHSLWTSEDSHLKEDGSGELDWKVQTIWYRGRYTK